MTSTDQRRSVVVGVAAAERWIGEIGVEGGLEVVHQVARRESEQGFPAFRRDARVTGLTATAPFLEEILTDAHPSILPPDQGRGYRFLVHEPLRSIDTTSARWTTPDARAISSRRSATDSPARGRGGRSGRG